MDLSRLQQALDDWWAGWRENRIAYRGTYRNGQHAPNEPVPPKPKKVRKFYHDDN